MTPLSLYQWQRLWESKKETLSMYYPRGLKNDKGNKKHIIMNQKWGCILRDSNKTPFFSKSKLQFLSPQYSIKPSVFA